MKKFLKSDWVWKLPVLALLAWALERQLLGQGDFNAMSAAFLQRMEAAPLWPLVLAMLLVPLNWALETEKWRHLMRYALPLPFARAYRAILAGVTFSLFTPNRIGEYGGRLLVAGRKHGMATILATVVSSLGQWLVLLGFGLAGFAVFALRHWPGGSAPVPEFYLWLAALLFVPALWLFFHLNTLATWLRQRFPNLRLLRAFTPLRRYSKTDLLRVLSLSVARYAVYVLQYLLLLHFFGIAPELLMALAGIATLYLLQTCLPLPPVVALMARSELALLVWGYSSDQPLLILGCTLALFILNLSLPALLGAVVIVQTHIPKTLSYEPQAPVSKLLRSAAGSATEPGTPPIS